MMLLALPVLVLVHRQYYFMTIQGPQLVRVSAALDAPEFAQVETSMVYADVILSGRVPELPFRETARALVDGIRGLRCREQDNHIQVPARLAATMTGTDLNITGWLHDEQTLRDAANWLHEARPDIEINTEGVQISPHVTLEEPPRAGNVPPAFRAAWAAIEVPASLRIVVQGSKPVVSGFLPSSALTEAVAAAVRGSKTDTAVDAHRLKSGVYVRSSKFADRETLPAFLRGFLGSPQPGDFEADENSVHVSGHVTPAMQQEWMPLLEKLANGGTLKTEFKVFPSVFHFPGYKPESMIPPDALAVLRDVLNATVIGFDPGVATTAAAELPKLTAAAAAIQAAGPEVRIIVGGHVDATGDPKTNETMARRRAESVVAELAGRNVPPHCLEVAVFAAVPGDADRSRRVELLVK